MTDVLTLNGNVLVISGSVLTGDMGGSEEIDLTPGVDFIDYDGSTMERWATADVAGKSALPDNPTHTGLTAQGWNWSLADIKAYMVNHPDAILTVGQMYTTTSGDTEIDCTFPAESLSPYLAICPNGTVEVDWGDGSAKDTVTGTSYTSLRYTQHTYATAGDYTVTIHVISGGFGFYSNSSAYSTVFSYRNALRTSLEYSSCITAIRLGSNVQLNSSALNGLINLKTITLPNNITYANSSQWLSRCFNLQSLSLPPTLTSIPTYCFQYCCNLKKLSLPNTITTINSSAFSNCPSLIYLTIPDTVTYINGSFNTCTNLQLLILSNNLATITSSTFSGCYNLSFLTLPSNLTSAGTSAFNSCYSLRYLTINDGLTDIPSGLFSNCQSLISLTIPAGVTTINSNAFSYAYSMRELHFQATTPPTIANSNAFTGLSTDCIIYVPTGTLSDYTSATNYPSSGTYTYMEE